jgi:hypothetical protein
VSTAALFPGVQMGAGMYESFYLRAFSPLEPVGVWIRHTAHKPPGKPARGSLWCTFFDARRPQPFMHKLSGEDLTAPAGQWIAVGERASIGPGQAQGACGDARWSLRYCSAEPELRHLSPAWLYRAPLPRTKLTSPAPMALFEGVFELAGHAPIELAGWPGMVGHNWGSEHAERWVWLHACGFSDASPAWIDVALGRLKIAGRMTPFLANGALSIDGRRHRIGGISARRPQVQEHVEGCELALAGEGGLTVRARVRVPEGSQAGWRYADPAGPEHDVVNCSISALELDVELPGSGPTRTLRTAHGCAYELGMRERDHGVAIAPFLEN